MSIANKYLLISTCAPNTLQVSEILAQSEIKLQNHLGLEILVNALVKKLHRHRGLTCTAPNTFEVTGK